MTRQLSSFPKLRAAANLACGAALTVALALAPGCAGRSPVDTTAPAAAPASAPAAPSGPAEQAVRLYDEGRYEEARPLLEQLDAEGKSTGPLLYRLGFCYDQTRDMNRKNEVMRRALAELQKEALTGDNLEVSFFRANALINLDQAGEARKVAADATAKIDRGEWPKPVKAIDEFRLAKLYQDQGRNGEASTHYRAALARWESDQTPAPGYQKWARRYLGQDALARADFRQAEEDLQALTELGGASAADFDRLAVCRVRLSDWEGAADAWRQAEKLEPANSDRPRYCRNLALLAKTAGPLPATSPKGTAWSAVPQADLESLMADQAKLLRDIRTEAAGSVTPQRKSEMTESVATAKAVFAAAGLEYAVRYLDIRQVAFTGGYAPLIFHPEEWTAEPPAQ